MIRLLITRPEFDDTTHYLSHWSKEAIDVAIAKGIKIYDLHRENANKIKFENLLKINNPDFVILNGHGDVDKVGGHKNEIIVMSNMNDNLLANKVVYAHSCSAAKVLGPTSVEKGAIAFLGYDEEFIFFYEPNNISRPLDDDTARQFLEPSTEAIISLLKGNTLVEAQKRAKVLFIKNMSKMLSSEASESDASMARYLWWDMKHLVLCGNNEAKLNL